MKEASLFGGVFEAERFWQTPQCCVLPSLHGVTPFVQDMDQLLFVYAKPDDAVLTTHRYSREQLSYWASLGLVFSPVCADCEEAEDPYAYFVRHPNYTLLEKISGRRFQPFAVLPSMKAFCERYNLVGFLPSMETIGKVNSKEYSVLLKKQLGIDRDSSLLCSLEELEVEAKRYLAQYGGAVIKEAFGVSGKGQFYLQRPTQLPVLCRHLHKQLDAGKTFSFIIEPFLEKASDFCCLFEITATGAVSFHSVQQLINQNGSYYATVTASLSLLSRLERFQYFKLMETIGRQLYREGYCGEVCIDSMLLSDDSIVPVLEINARRSMSLLKHTLDERLPGHSCQTALQTAAFFSPESLSFGQLLDKLDQAGVLYRNDRRQGVFPFGWLSSPAESNGWHYKLYAYITNPESSSVQHVWDALRNKTDPKIKKR